MSRYPFKSANIMCSYVDFFFLQLCYDFLFFNDIVFAHFVIHKTVVREKVFICSSLLSVYLKEAQIITCQRKEDTKINGN